MAFLTIFYCPLLQIERGIFTCLEKHLAEEELGSEQIKKPKDDHHQPGEVGGFMSGFTRARRYKFDDPLRRS